MADHNHIPIPHIVTALTEQWAHVINHLIMLVL